MIAPCHRLHGPPLTFNLPTHSQDSSYGEAVRGTVPFEDWPVHPVLPGCADCPS